MMLLNAAVKRCWFVYVVCVCGLCMCFCISCRFAGVHGGLLSSSDGVMAIE